MCEVERYEENIPVFLGFVPLSAIHIYLCSVFRRIFQPHLSAAATEVLSGAHSCVNRADTFHLVSDSARKKSKCQSPAPHYS